MALCANRKVVVQNERFRQQYVFWLDMNKPDEAVLAGRISELKTSRKFAKTIRDGIRLIEDLQAGRLDVLFALFPNVSEHLQSPLYANEIASLLEQLRRLTINGQTHNAFFAQNHSPSIPEVKAVLNETEAIQRSVINTLASLEDF